MKRMNRSANQRATESNAIDRLRRSAVRIGVRSAVILCRCPPPPAVHRPPPTRPCVLVNLGTPAGADAARGAPIPGRIPARPSRRRPHAAGCGARCCTSLILPLRVAGGGEEVRRASGCRTRARRWPCTRGAWPQAVQRELPALARGARDALRRARAGRALRDACAREGVQPRARAAAVSAVFDHDHRLGRRRGGAASRDRRCSTRELSDRRLSTSTPAGSRAVADSIRDHWAAHGTRRAPAVLLPRPAAARRRRRRSVSAPVRGQRARDRRRAGPAPTTSGR